MYDQEKDAKTRNIEKEEIAILCKQWHKPIITTINAAELKKHIMVAARSTSCASEYR